MGCQATPTYPETAEIGRFRAIRRRWAGCAADCRNHSASVVVSPSMPPALEPGVHVEPAPVEEGPLGRGPDDSGPEASGTLRPRAGALPWLALALALGAGLAWVDGTLTKIDPAPGLLLRWFLVVLEHPYRSACGTTLLLHALAGARAPRG